MHAFARIPVVAKEREAFVFSTLQRTNSHPIPFSPFSVGRVQCLFICSFTQHLSLQTKSHLPGNQHWNPFIYRGKARVMLIHVGPRGRSKRGWEWSRSGEGSCVFSADHSGLLGFGWKADILEMLFPSKFRLWKIHCVVPFKPNGRASPHNKTELWITFLTTAISPAIPKGAEGEFELSVCFASAKRRL